MTTPTPSTMVPLEFNPELDIDRLRDEFRKTDRVQIVDFLKEECAQALHKCLAEDLPWDISFMEDENVRVANARAYDNMSPQQKAQILQKVMMTARDDFQFFYDSYRVDVALEAGTGDHFYVHRFFEFMNSKPLLDFMRMVTGMTTMDNADAHATRYRPGSFLTEHNDYDVNASRLCAYVMNLTPSWRQDWGGILNFYDDDNNVIEGFKPRWNTINLLRVPQSHSVSYVPPFAGAHRFSVTGWLRDKSGKNVNAKIT